MGELLLKIGSICTALIAIIRIYKPLRLMVVKYIKKKIMDIVESRINTIDKKLDDVLFQLKPDSGRSIYDSIKRIENKVNTIDERMVVLGSLVWSILDENYNDGIMLANENGIVTRTNKAMRTITGRESNELYGKDWLNAIKPEQRQEVEKAYMDAITEQRRLEMSVVIRNKDGNLKNMNLYTYPIFNNNVAIAFKIVLREA